MINHPFTGQASMLGNPFPSLNGTPISPHRLIVDYPVLELSETVSLTSQFRAETNAWLRKMFGIKRTVLNVGGELLVSQETYDILKKLSVESQNELISSITDAARFI